MNAFNATLDESLAVDRPTMSLAYGDSLGTKIGALADLVTGNYFEDAAKKRVVVVFTDGETLKERLSTLPARFKDGHLRVFFFHYWRPDQRVYNAAGQIIPAYLPDPNTTAVLGNVICLTWGRPLACPTREERARIPREPPFCSRGNSQWQPCYAFAQCEGYASLHLYFFCFSSVAAT